MQLIEKDIHGEETGLQETHKMLQQKGHFLGDGRGLKYPSDYNRLLPGESGGEPKISTLSNYL